MLSPTSSAEPTARTTWARESVSAVVTVAAATVLQGRGPLHPPSGNAGWPSLLYV